MQYIIVGLGGQGILFASRVLGQIALKRGENVIGSEVHGMAQRGGSVISHFKVGPYKCPLISAGDADVLLAFDQNEAIRNLHFLKDGGHCVINVHRREAFQNESLKTYLAKRKIDAFLLNGYEILNEHMGGNYLFLNVLILGAMGGLNIGGISFEEIKEAVSTLSPAKFRDDNLKALELGKNAVHAS
ncbi:MAG TPA: 2-oxoacid:acceptor oxidoreductase family protein [Acetomicrobium flavidum]|uniref:Indolepyruvate ferredoxin oxidoreductase beta subunit n=1 Tax=Acetomicrobium flavidum TaxID=49896 RepID=A0ABY1JCM1_9BACT|nr:indolepyruvate ferredoxin oxidoreductase [Acetomicrobium flavidum]SIN66162.1 indolepyruvate ferredoxin oxidoreductase beta subunit [Acetomicrobium flavidum]HOJ82541.1 2-oxoacid:acceptor oxidoreductase family protein [Acetomicrobium flavidum]HOM31606.1 2-oxoacid:acceptor oxidoreductase family protein [Acetomicrobium flavidum]HOP88138.1 2-oxoacid:acceptor oxidoreductase family protein [Acetomicrobium flavidum]